MCFLSLAGKQRVNGKPNVALRDKERIDWEQNRRAEKINESIRADDIYWKKKTWKSAVETCKVDETTISVCKERKCRKKKMAQEMAFSVGKRTPTLPAKSFLLPCHSARLLYLLFLFTSFSLLIRFCLHCFRVIATAAAAASMSLLSYTFHFYLRAYCVCCFCAVFCVRFRCVLAYYIDISK